MPDDSYWTEVYCQYILDNKNEGRLQEIENDMGILQSQIKELHSKHNKLSNERTEIIQDICDHNFEWTGYCEDDFERDIIKYEEQCPKCGLKRWDEL